MNRTHSLLTLCMLLLFALVTTGCSISDSVSDSISSPFESSSGSSASSSGDRRAAYEADVRDYTQAYVRSGGDFDRFMTGLGTLATKHGVTNWEADSATYVGIGRGLKAGGVNKVQLDVYKANISKGDAQKAADMQKGYDSEE